MTVYVLYKRGKVVGVISDRNRAMMLVKDDVITYFEEFELDPTLIFTRRG